MNRLLQALLIATAACLPACAYAVDGVDAFRALPDNRIAVHTSYGVRYARPLTGTRVELGIGLSRSPSAAEAESYRVLSFEDATYAYDNFVRPLKATMQTERETSGPADSTIAVFERSVIALHLPFPMQDGKTYHVVAQGGGGRHKGLMVTAAHCAQSFTYQSGVVPPRPDNAVDLAVMGLRTVEPVGPRLLLVTFGANFSAVAGTQPGSYTVTINDRPARVTRIGRRTMVETYIPVGWPYKAVPYHEVFLELDRPVEDGDTVAVTADETVTTATRTAAMRFESRRTLSNSIKVNQVGYLTDSPIKVAYLGRWMGSFPEGRENGNPALFFAQAPAFSVCEQASGEEVFTGTSRLIHTSGTMDEGVYKHDHSGENVYLLDFTAFTRPGEFFISVAGVGRSLPFRIAGDVYDEAFQVQSHGVFVQRCGIELGPPYTPWRRIACHAGGVTPLRINRHDKYDWKTFPQHTEPGRVIETHGGHHDAGDYNPRSHIDVAQSLMDAYEIAPQKFFDGQLNIPEQHNGIPDILDEAHWAMQLWFGLQDEDGGVHHGTESNGDPNFIQSVELDVLGDYAFAKDAAGSFTFAGVMAQASRIWKSLGREEDAERFLERGCRAYAWALLHPPADDAMQADGQRRWRDPLAYASAELLLTTGAARFNNDFLSVNVWSKESDSPLDKYKTYDQGRAAWAYARCASAAAEPRLQKLVRAAIVREADRRIHFSSQMAYAFIRHPEAPITWGTGAYQNWLTPVIWSWKLTGEDTYRLWMIRTCDNTLGANPLNRSYIVGAGMRTVRAPLHNSRYSHLGEVVMGQQVEGPNRRGDGYGVVDTAYPSIRDDFASLYTFADCHFCIAMDEGVVKAQAMSMATFGLLLPDRR